VVDRLPQFVEGRLEARARGFSGTTPYARLLDWPVVILLLVILGCAVLVARFKR
jgi:apolipoprotein N-acyltransferase